ncbi:hypothetical protein A7982_12155 [Minicystis rosea]|nr:hypothetical protein A7982_12155 [Minicystis rosea]
MLALGEGRRTRRSSTRVGGRDAPAAPRLPRLLMQNGMCGKGNAGA